MRSSVDAERLFSIVNSFFVDKPTLLESTNQSNILEIQEKLLNRVFSLPKMICFFSTENSSKVPDFGAEVREKVPKIILPRYD